MSDSNWALVKDIAKQIRDKKRDITTSFMWIAEQALNIRDSELWKNVSETWEAFCCDDEVGLGMAPSSIRSLIDIYQLFVAGNMLTMEEAQDAGWQRLNTCKATIKKVPADKMEDAKEILVGQGKMADIKRDLRTLVPIEKRKPISHVENFIRFLSKAWAELNEVDVEDVDPESRGKIHDYIDKIESYLLR